VASLDSAIYAPGTLRLHIISPAPGDSVSAPRFSQTLATLARPRDSVSSTSSRVLTGILVGGVAGAIGGYAFARREVNHCSPRECGGGPALEVVVDPIMFGAVGAAVGGFVGWLWPHR
jgi:hypothetical protein